MSIGGDLRGALRGMATRTTGRGRQLGVGVLATVCLLVATPVMAHDLADASATLIVRDGGHLQLRLQVPWADVLRAQWMPKASTPEFLAKVVSMPRAEFARDLIRVQAVFERDARVVADHGRPLVFARWRWPSATEVQEALRRELMSRLADGDRFEHFSRLSATSDLALGRSPVAVRLGLPAALGNALVTVYRPAEQWVKAGAWSASVVVKR